MLKKLGSMTKKTRDYMYYPAMFDGKLDSHGLQLYRFP
jgi:hypothetical protein